LGDGRARRISGTGGPERLLVARQVVAADPLELGKGRSTISVSRTMRAKRSAPKAKSWVAVRRWLSSQSARPDIARAAARAASRSSAWSAGLRTAAKARVPSPG